MNKHHLSRQLGMCAIVLVCSGAIAQAQQTSDLMPPPPPDPTSARVWVPGVPPPGGATTAPPPATGEAAPSNAGRGSAILTNGTISVVGAPTPADSNAKPTTVRVEVGDTLWNISQRYLGNPWYWPRLWSYNPSVSNPHWLFPGDTLRLAPAGLEEVTPQASPTSAPTSTPTPASKSLTLVAPKSYRGGLTLRQNGFLDEGELKKSSVVIGSSDDRDLLSRFDQVYLETKPQYPLEVGKKYSIYHEFRKVKHPITGKPAGVIVQIDGEVKVEEMTSSGIARAVITDAINPIERGHRVGAVKRQFHDVDPVPNKVDIDGLIITALQPTELLGSDMLVFVDRGRDEGVEPGNRFDVVRRGDDNKGGLKHEPTNNPKYPREVIGYIFVLDVYPHAAAGMLLGTIKEVRMGDRVELRRAP